MTRDIVMFVELADMRMCYFCFVYVPVWLCVWLSALSADTPRKPKYTCCGGAVRTCGACMQTRCGC